MAESYDFSDHVFMCSRLLFYFGPGLGICLRHLRFGILWEEELLAFMFGLFDCDGNAP